MLLTFFYLISQHDTYSFNSLCNNLIFFWKGNVSLLGNLVEYFLYVYGFSIRYLLFQFIIISFVVIEKSRIFK